MRKGEIISIIPKTDYRYKLISFITFNVVYAEEFNNVFTYKYYCNNLYNYEGRKVNNSDIIHLTLTEYNYSIWIGKQYPKSVNCNKNKSII
jgi:hypothetical protein